jgi:hypothetical protein
MKGRSSNGAPFFTPHSPLLILASYAKANAPWPYRALIVSVAFIRPSLWMAAAPEMALKPDP